MHKLRKLLLGNASLATVYGRLPALTAKQLADVLSKAYVGLGLHHLDNQAKRK